MKPLFIAPADKTNPFYPPSRLPYVYCKVVRNDSSIRFYHFFTGPYLWFRPTPEAPTGVITDVVPDYYEGHRHEDFDTIARNESAEIEERREVQTAGRPTEAVSSDAILSLPKSEKEHKDIYDDDSSKGDGSRKNETVLPTQPQPSKLAALEKILGQPLKDSTGPDGRPIPPNYRTFDGTWLEPWNLWIVLRYNALPWVWFTLSAGLRTDIHKVSLQIVLLLFSSDFVLTASHFLVSRLKTTDQLPSKSVLETCTLVFKSTITRSSTCFHSFRSALPAPLLSLTVQTMSLTPLDLSPSSTPSGLLNSSQSQRNQLLSGSWLSVELVSSSV